MFSIKICGIKSAADACAVAEAGGDAVGFNFYGRSPRFISADAARAIAVQMPEHVWKVGVFVDEPSRAIGEICRSVGLDCVQLHGDEPAEIIAELPTSVSIVRAFRLGRAGLAPLVDYCRRCRDLGRGPDAVLVDAHVPSVIGGSGQTVDWEALAGQKSLLGGIPLILAGGLTPENVRAAIEVVRPSGVDVASGVEAGPGVKEHATVRRFIDEARIALADFRSALPRGN